MGGFKEAVSRAHRLGFGRVNFTLIKNWKMFLVVFVTKVHPYFLVFIGPLLKFLN